MSYFGKSLQVMVVAPLAFNTFLGNSGNELPGLNRVLINPTADSNLLSQKEMSLDNRYNNTFVNNVFRDNILLNLAYLGDKIRSPKDINWDEIRKPFFYEFKLKPGKSFAFHSDVSAKYEDTLVKTTNAHFNSAEGFKTDGYLFGDGVCHLASLIYWTAKEANLWSEAPTNHDFAVIPDIPREFGVSIYSNPFSRGSNSRQNLYITNNKSNPIAFRFQYADNRVKVSVVELN